MIQMKKSRFNSKNDRFHSKISQSFYVDAKSSKRLRCYVEKVEISRILAQNKRQKSKE